MTSNLTAESGLYWECGVRMDPEADANCVPAIPNLGRHRSTSHTSRASEHFQPDASLFFKQLSAVKLRTIEFHNRNFLISVLQPCHRILLAKAHNRHLKLEPPHLQTHRRQVPQNMNMDGEELFAISPHRQSPSFSHIHIRHMHPLIPS